MEKLEWHGLTTLDSRKYVCGYCGNPLASEKGYFANRGGSGGPVQDYIYICHNCFSPTFISPRLGTQTPGAIFGNPVKDIPETAIRSLYDEARKATSTGSYTASVLCCRKLLMHIAVSKGAPAGGSFISYVEYLAANNYVPPDAKDWVDHIRKKGNEANHEIVLAGKEDAEDLISFIEMLLKVIYEFPAAIKKKTAKP
jgi:hypothetical protein